MSSPAEAEGAIKGLNGMSVGGRSIVVNISRPKEPGTGYGNGGGGGGGGYRGERSRY